MLVGYISWLDDAAASTALPTLALNYPKPIDPRKLLNITSQVNVNSNCADNSEGDDLNINADNILSVDEGILKTAIAEMMPYSKYMNYFVQSNNKYCIKRSQVHSVSEW